MNDNFDQYNKAPISYKDFLRKSAQDTLDELQKSQQASASGTPQVDTYVAPPPPSEPQFKPQAPVPQQASILGAPTQETQAFGNQNPGVEVFSKGINSGADFAANPGTPVALPPGKWKVLSSFSGDNTPGHVGDNTNSGYGNSVFAQNVDTGEKLRFSHLSQVGVQPDQTLDGGTVVGATGQTGNVTGPHLDLEYYNQNGQLADILKSIYAQYLKMQ